MLYVLIIPWETMRLWLINSLLNTHKWDLSNLIETVSVSRLSNLSYLVKVRIPKIILIIHT